MTVHVPIYTSQGDCPAYMGYPYIYNLNGDWIAFVSKDRNVYSVYGEYIGRMTNDPRIVRTISRNIINEKRTPPPPPPKARVTNFTAIAPMMTDLPNTLIDVLQDEPYKFFNNYKR